MQSIERLGEAFNKAAAALAEFAAALAECISCSAECLGEAFAQFVAGADIAPIAAYTAASQEHPEWVHRATYSKKKRIRKKYHNRIMRMYGRE